MHRNKYQKPNIEDLMNSIGNPINKSKNIDAWFSTVDLKYAYSQLNVQKLKKDCNLIQELWNIATLVFYSGISPVITNSKQNSTNLQTCQPSSKKQWIATSHLKKTHSVFSWHFYK